MIKMIVFDMAGTVVNENNVVYKTLQKAINEAGTAVTLTQVLAYGAGKEKLNAVRDIVAKYDPSKDEEYVERAYKNFLVMLNEAYQNLEVSPIDGAEELFLELKKRGIYVVLNTGYNRKTAEQLLTKLHWSKDNQVDEVVTASDVSQTRPHPDMILHAMKLKSISDAKEVLKIGDSQIDIEEGKNAGCGITVGITTGAHTREQLEEAHPDYIVDSLADVIALLK